MISVFMAFQSFPRPGSEEDLLFSEHFELQATLAEYNGNAHGPEKMSCSVSQGLGRCRRSGEPAASMRGTHVAHVEHETHGMSHAPAKAPAKSVQLRAVLLEVGDTCVLGASSCPKGSVCQAGSW